VKRLIKEAYRLNKYSFDSRSALSGKQIDIAFLFLKNEIPDYKEIEKAMLKALSILNEKTGKKNEDEGMDS